MPRLLTQTAFDAIFAQETDTIMVAVVTIFHPSFVGSTVPVPAVPPGTDADPTPNLDGEIRLYQNRENVKLVSGGKIYNPFPFTIPMPNDDEQPSGVKFRIGNVDRSVIQLIRNIPPSSPRPTVKSFYVLLQTPDIIEVGPFNFKMRDIAVDAQFIEASLIFEDVLNEPYPGIRFDPDTYPDII